MTIQTVNLGAAPTGAGGDTFRSTGAKINENFTNNAHAASRYVGSAAGNLMEVGFCGLGSTVATNFGPIDLNTAKLQTGFYSGNNINNAPFANNNDTWGYLIHQNLASVGAGSYEFQMMGTIDGRFWTRTKTGGQAQSWLKVLNSGNTTTDANGFIKAASPIVKLFTDKIEPNDEAAEQPLSFVKLDIGHYLVKGSSGFAKEGWWIEIPTDTHGNKICAVEYQTLENGDLEIKTFKKKMNDEGDIVANLDAPIEIPTNANGEPRWIDIRLNSIKKTIISKIPRTEKQPRMVQQIKYSMQPTFMTRLTELIDDEGKVVMVDGKPFQKKETYLVTDSSGMATLTKQPVINENGEPVLEWVQAFDSEGNPVFDDVQVKDKDGNPIFDEVIHESE
ncbi:pyocin knob domain-containing protein [Acinetobacter nosocomialis]|uniref:pyocin knob domain-containing protein n=1 Tax=Acinetobacter nosocomialis TaxID=106654 RepID=UPI00374F2383